MKSKGIITSLTAAALAGAVLSGANISENVKADVKPEGTTTKAQSAEENAQANVDSAQKEVDNAQKEVDAAKNDLNSAKKNAEKPDADYAEQKDKTDAAQKTADEKKTALDKVNDKEKQAEDLAKEANRPGVIDNAEQAVKDQNKDLTQKQQAVTDAEKQVPEKQQVVDSAQKEVNAKNADLTEKQAVKNVADKQVKDAENALNNTDTKEIEKTKEELDKANDNVKEDKTALAGAQNDVDEFTKQQGELQKELDQKRSETKNSLEQAQAEQEQAAENEKKAQDEYTGTQIAIKKFRNIAERLKHRLSSVHELSKNNISIPDIDSYKKAYSDYVTNKELTSDDIDYVNYARNQNIYVPSDVDNYNVETNNLNDDQLQELSLFTADLLSKLRSQLGWSADQVTQGSLKMAKDIAAGYVRDKWTGSWHDGNAINDAAENNGLLSVSDSDARSTEQYYENKTNIPTDTPSISMNNLKKSIYNAILDMIFPNGNGFDSPDETTSKYEMGHAAGLLGADPHSAELKEADFKTNDNLKKQLEEAKNLVNNINKYRDTEFKGKVAGISYSFIVNNGDIKYLLNNKTCSKDELINTFDGKIKEVKNAGQYVAVIPTNIKGIFSIHFVNIGSYYLDSDSTNQFDTTSIQTYADQITELSSRIQRCKEHIDKLESKAAQKAKARNDAEQTLAKAKAKVAEISNPIFDLQEQLKIAGENIFIAQDEVTRCTKLLNDDQAKANGLQKHYNELTASKDEKNKALQVALSKQSQAKTALDNAQTALDTANQKLDQAKSDQDKLAKDIVSKQSEVIASQIKLNQLKQHLSDLKNAAQTLAAAQADQTNAQKDYDAAKKVADDAQAQLKTLETVKSVSDVQVSAAQAKYDQALANLKNAEDKLANAKSTLERIQQADSLVNQPTASQTTPDTGNFVGQVPADTTNTSTQNTNNQTTTNTNTTSQTNPDSTSSTAVSTKTKTIRLTHNAYVYTRGLKPVRTKSHKKVVIKKNHYLKALNNGKTVTIKGKKFYQIGKNRFIRVSNTVAKKGIISATIKGRKNQRVKVYFANGKFAKKYVLGQKTYKFAEKKTIKGKTYYRISGKKLWVRAKDLKLVK